MQDFKRLHAWQRAYTLAITLHGAARPFTRNGGASLHAQLTRAADSVAPNIAEGCGSATSKELARFLDIAIKSANETEHHLLCARDLGLLLPLDWQRYSNEIVEIRKMTYGYRKRILASPTPHV